jgi:hypothetical protein
MAVATIVRSETVSGFQPDDRYKSCGEARMAGWIFSQGRYSTKRDQFRASHISRAQGIGAHKPSPASGGHALWLPNSWPFPSDLQSRSGYGGLLRPWQRYDGSQMHRGVRRREWCIRSDPAMPAKLANAYLKRGRDVKKGRLDPSAQLLVQPGSPKSDTCERL